MGSNLLGFAMRFGTNKEKNTKLGEGLWWLAKESHGIWKKKKKKPEVFVNLRRFEIINGDINKIKN